jgi:ABC-2 type transport system permease protein
VNARRTFEVFRLEFSHSLRRPLFWVQLLLLAFMTFMLAAGKASIGSGDANVGGHKAWITSEFAITQTLIMLISIWYVFFISVAAGMAVIRDDEQGVGELLHSTPLTPAEYVWGKYLAVLASFLGVLVLHVGLAMTCNHLIPHGATADYIGPFAAGNYLRPVLVFAVPTIVLFTGACFAIGGVSRLPVLVFAFPIAVLIVDAFFLWDWSPLWLTLGMNRVLQFVDPTGLRWLKESWLRVDHGVDFYNHGRVGLDALVITQRFVVTALGLGCVAFFERHFATHLRGARTPRVTRGIAVAATPAARSAAPAAAMATLGMVTKAPGVLATTLEVMRAELHQLVRAPGLYLFVPLILIQTLLNEYGVGAYDTPLLSTAGGLATGMMNTLTLLVCMVILFYTTESLQRERGSGFGAIYYATPLRTGAMLAGKVLANTVLALAIVLACLLGCMILLAVQGKVPLDLLPFAIVWGLLLVPTYVVWTAFVAAVYAATSSRYATYGVGLAVMCASGWFQMRGKTNWVFNWDLWSSTRWTDIATFQYDSLPLLLNRITWLGVAVFLTVLTVRLFERRERDATAALLRMQPGALAGAFASLLPFLLPSLIAGGILGFQVTQGYQGAAAKKARMDYWRRNIQTWKDAPVPALAGVDLDVRLDPARHALAVKGWYEVENRSATPLARFPVTINPRWTKLAWTVDAKPCSTESRAGLVIVNPPRPIPPGGTLRLGFSFEGRHPDGISRNGGYDMEFIEPSSVVLAGFASVAFVPQLGFFPDDAIEEDKNKSDPKEWADGWWQGETRAGLPMADRWYDVHMRVDVPADLQVNATGEKVGETVKAGRRVSEWRTDHPVRIFNLVAGRWAVRTRDGVAVYYDPRHPYNVDEMLDALAGARRWYGEWFAPYPWKTLRLSEFAGWPTYAQAPPGNITFSENIGFLTRSRPEANAAFWIAAHESAHMWWPNIAMAADGPGATVLSEGMAHFSTTLLTGKVKGEQQRQAWCRSMEKRYNESRRADSERPLTKLDGQMPGDDRIWYEKGGWALWMLHRFQGESRSFAAIREYIETYRDSRDHAALEDYLAIQRRHAADSTAFDAFTKQWFFAVVVPHYLIEDAKLERDGEGWSVVATVRNVGTGTMPVEVASVRGERFPAPGAKPKPWRETRTTVLLAAGQRATVTLRSGFQPERLIVDPDVTVLMAERRKAEVTLALDHGVVALR